MRRYKLAAVLMVILVAFAVPSVGAAQTESTLEGPVLNIGHRGASTYAPEHTFAAYDLALEQGADYIEIDLQMTADGVLVALHDKTLNRTADAPEGVPEPTTDTYGPGFARLTTSGSGSPGRARSAGGK